MTFITSFAFDDEDIFFTPERHNKMLHCGFNVRKIWLCIYGPSQSEVGFGLPEAHGPLVEWAWCRLLHMATTCIFVVGYYFIMSVGGYQFNGF